MICFLLNTNLTNLTNMASRCALAVGSAECMRPGGTYELLRCLNILVIREISGLIINYTRY